MALNGIVFGLWLADLYPIELKLDRELVFGGNAHPNQSFPENILVIRVLARFMSVNINNQRSIVAH